MTHTQCLRVWDYIIAYCLNDTASISGRGANKASVGSESLLDVLLETSNSNTSQEAVLSKSRYGPHSSLLAGVVDIMLGMLLSVS